MPEGETASQKQGSKTLCTLCGRKAVLTGLASQRLDALLVPQQRLSRAHHQLDLGVHGVRLLLALLRHLSLLDLNYGRLLTDKRRWYSFGSFGAPKRESSGSSGI
eukprot:scaffold707_cov240-Pinguiococcus_pyrenoidosus.AAC.8